jgi:hypothetical protein
VRYEQVKPLVERLMDICILYHESPTLLREKIYTAIDMHIPHLDQGCFERGCACYDINEGKNERTGNL